MARIKREDEVVVVSGKDNGKKGKVLRVFSEEGKVLVQGINLVKKHMRPTQENPKGGIVEVEKPIQISNVQLVCPSCSKPSRVGYSILSDGSKNRICKKCQEII